MSDVLLEGILSVSAAVTYKSRDISDILIDVSKYKKRDRKITSFIAFLNRLNIPYQLTEREKIDALTVGHTHGGVVAVTSLKKETPLEALLEGERHRRYYVLLDDIEDPYNLGYACRAFYAMGCAGILLPKRDLSNCEGIISKASAGAYEGIPVATYADESEVLCASNAHNITVCCSAKNQNSIGIFDFAPTFPFIMCIGGEKRGISPAFMENAAYTVHIPYAKNIKYSLNATAVCAMYAEAFFHFANE